MIVEFTLNGEAVRWEMPPDTKLLDALRVQGLIGTKQGCREATCGACTVLLNGRAVFSCALLLAQAQGGTVETVEGLGSVSDPHPLQRALVDASAVQCGFCIPGVLMSAKGLLDQDPNPSEGAIRRALNGNLCRCTGYVKIIEGVTLAAEEMRRRV
ncbi:(2Fe-2S)-binding protein [Myxococcota bacterium]|nr:(2Fe-2S)-binding protein [Myxococcota bacterium]MBU1430534.1 (2Fe-2S)-binding protein [Myxococcota bacterium]MBU1899147.1 (2Fe-2S)-binding protein [Myxococcota bacterium]